MKGQMEIMGLAIIIILVMLGMVFVVKFTLLSPKDDLKSDFTRKQIAQNMLNSILVTHIGECGGVSVSELISDCAIHSPNAGSISCGGFLHSCSYLDNEAGPGLKTQFFGHTLEVWKIPYRLTITTDPSRGNFVDFSYPEEPECNVDNIPSSYDKLDKAQSQIGRLGGSSPIQVSLDVCS